MVVPGEELEREALFHVAQLMCLAARTAPKGGGIDNLVTAVVGGEGKDRLAREMRRLADEYDMEAFRLNAQDVEQAPWVVLLGIVLKRYGVRSCNFCGYEGCKKNREANGICAMAVNDLGIALGSAVSVAALHHADNRIMYTIGRAALNLKLLGEDVRIAYGIPLSATGKNPFFDRQWQKVYGVEGWKAK